MVTKDDKRLAWAQIIASGMFALAGITISVGLVIIALNMTIENLREDLLFVGYLSVIAGFGLIAAATIGAKRDMDKIKEE